MATYGIMVEQPWFQRLLIDSHFVILLEDISHRFGKQPVWTKVKDIGYPVLGCRDNNIFFKDLHEPSMWINHPDKVVP